MGGLVENKEFMKKHSVTPKVSKAAMLWEDRVYLCSPCDAPKTISAIEESIATGKEDSNENNIG